MNRRNILIGLGVVAAGAAAGGAWWRFGRGTATPPMASAGGGGAPTQPTVLAESLGDVPLMPDDHILGKDTASVTIVEYASLTCPHCAAFEADTFPEVKKNWVDTGRARFVFRHYPLDQIALRAAAVADCIPGDGFFGFINVLFANQLKWARSDNPYAEIGRYAALAGLDQATVDKCMNDKAKLNAILQRQAEARDKYNVDSTPSFLINGTPLVGERTYDQFNSALEKAATKSS